MASNVEVKDFIVHVKIAARAVITLGHNESHTALVSVRVHCERNLVAICLKCKSRCAGSPSRKEKSLRIVYDSL